ncbi:MAG: hypothetical protein LBP72_09460 [Dysgonamonadaceae bacterium]|jgi:hypothetical protein|nr:hypothetical protein [Dysgonamonadaceae bacterium]
MKKVIPFTIMILTGLFSFQAQAIGELISTDARSFALGNLHALSREFLNPASLSFHTNPQASVSVLNQFEMKELNTFYLGGKYPNPYVDAGLTVSHYGYTDYRIVQVQSGFAKKILPNLAVGLNLIYFSESSFLEERDRNCLSSDIGLYYQFNPKLAFAFLAANLLHTFPDRIENFYGGLSYEVVENCSFLLETHYGVNRYFNLSLGIEYELVEKFKIRTGIQTGIKAPSFGVAFQQNLWTMDAGFSLHPVLGVSSIIGVNYHF